VAASSWVTHPQFGAGGASDTHDIAVVLLPTAPAGITPAQLPTAGLLDQLKAAHELDDQTFTAVGYGTVREDKTGRPHSLFFDGVRRYALQHALNLEKAWLLLWMNPSTGNGGTCYGDSGGPHFLGGVESNLVVSITITGDAWCRASDKTYRLDTASPETSWTTSSPSPEPGRILFWQGTEQRCRMRCWTAVLRRRTGIATIQETAEETMTSVSPAQSRCSGPGWT
jgi:Trypsin